MESAAADESGTGTAANQNDNNEADTRAKSDEELEAEARLKFMPAYLSGPLDPARMELSTEERQWALEVKEAIQSQPDLDDLSDFMIAQIALVEFSSQSMETAVQHAHNVQAYRQEFDVLDTFQQGKRALAYFIKMQPGHILHFFNAEDRYAVVFDLTKFDISLLSTPESKKNTLRGAYYFNHTFCLDLAAVRRGVLWIMECEGMRWKAPKMLNFQVFRIGMQDVAGNYPLHLYKMRFCNTGVLVNTLTSMVRRYIPEQIHSKFELGHQNETRLDTVCMVPNVEVATDRVLREMTEALRRRYEAEETFRL